MTKKLTTKEKDPEPKIIESAIEEIFSAVTETVKGWRELQIRTYWESGRILRDTAKDNGVGISALVMHCAADERLLDVKMGQRSLWFGIKLFDWTEGDFEKVYATDHGQNISVTKLKKELMAPADPKPEPTVAELAERVFNKLGVAGSKEFIKELQTLIREVK